MTFKGIIVQRSDQNYARVVSAGRTPGLSLGTLIPLAASSSKNDNEIQKFIFHEGKAYPADKGICSSTALNAKKSEALASTGPEPTESQPDETTEGSASSIEQNASDGSDPWAWQKEALKRWENANYKGIVEAATGSGKTYLAMDAIQHYKELSTNRTTFVLVVVPSLKLQEQWHDRLSSKFKGKHIARIGGGYKEHFGRPKPTSICVAVINSLVGVGRRAEEAPFRDLLKFIGSNKDYHAMLVADECHHYIEAPVFQRIRDYKYNAVLALSATVGSDNYWIKGFNCVIQTYSLANAITDGAVAKPLIRNISCKLNAEEEPLYAEYSKNISDYRQIVEQEFEYELRGKTRDDFWRTLVMIDSRVDGGIPEIRRFFSATFKRSSLVYQAKEKEVAAQRIIRKLLNKGRKVIVFFERIDSIHRAEGMSQGRIEEFENSIRQAAKEETAYIGSLHSGMDQSSRDRVLADFAENKCGVLFCCRMVDEGYDLPDIDAAVIVASSQSERQRIQRAGRVLRRGDGDKQALIVTLYCEGTSDAYIIKNDATLFSAKSDIRILNSTELIQEI